jgi:hypothetical protein
VTPNVLHARATPASATPPELLPLDVPLSAPVRFWASDRPFESLEQCSNEAIARAHAADQLHQHFIVGLHTALATFAS